jgi:hypothetical protein
LRRLLTAADKKAEQLGIPGTDAVDETTDAADDDDLGAVAG